MAEITAAMVMKLREETGLPMMECKKALQTNGGDMEAAKKWLREQGIKTQSTRIDRATECGRIAVYVDADKNVAAMIEILCESPPVAGSPEFRDFANAIAKQLATGPGAATPDELLKQPSPMKPGQTIAEQKDDMFNRIREVFNLSRMVRINGRCGGYAHHDGASGALVEVTGGPAELAKEVAMHVVAQKPLVVNKEQLDPALVEKEREILSTAARQEGKPENIIAKMVEGRLRNFFAERALVEQPFIKDDSQTVGKLAGAAKMEIIKFVRWELGKPEEGTTSMHAQSTDDAPHFRRVVLKLSGESFCTHGERGISMDEVGLIANQTVKAAQSGVQIAIVIGGGNILRGAQFKAGSNTIQEATAHYMGMLATVLNGLALQDALESLGRETRLLTAIRMDGVAEPYIRRRARRHLDKGRIVILAAGTGSPFVTTDTAAAQRALELEADILLKATRVDGVYSDDPEKNPHAMLYSELSYQAVREQNLRVMDPTAIAQCMEHDMPILVFNFRKEGNIERAVNGSRVGTIISSRAPATKQPLQGNANHTTIFPRTVLRASRPGDLAMSVDEILMNAEEGMEKTLAVLKHNLTGIRTGRANPGLVDSLKVPVYGSESPIKALASVGCPEPTQIVIRPFDPGTIKDIEKAIQASGLGFNPQSDGRMIRISVPPLSTEVRRKLAARIKELTEEAKVAVRNIRRDANKDADQEQKDKVLTEDERDSVKEEVQELTKKFENLAGNLAASKEVEVMED